MSYSLFLYHANEAEVGSPVPNEAELMLPWLEENAKPLGSLELEQGECYALFKALQLLCDEDLLPLVGGNLNEPSSDDEYCSGTVPRDVLARAISTLYSRLQPPEGEEPDKEGGTAFSLANHPQVTGYLQSQGISEEWFGAVLQGFLQMLARAGENRVIGLF